MIRKPLADLAKNPFDVVVIGAGINGSGAAQEIVARGYRVLIVDKDDFAAGATNRSSRILHCGLRHLAPGKSVWDFVVCTQKEVDWMLSEINFVIPKLNLTRGDVHYTYAGIQPVSYDAKDPKGTRQIRVHDLSDEGFPNLLMLTGGPIMTYRIIGSDLADAVAKRISPSGSARELSYFPSAVTEKIQKEQSGHSTGPLGATILKRIIEEEQTSSLIDLFFRRSDMGWDPDRGGAKLASAARIMAETLGWDDAQQQQQIDSYHSYIEEVFPSHR